MTWPKKHRALWEFLVLWGIWMLLILALTDIQQYPNRFATRAFASFVSFFIVIQINANYLFPYLFLRKRQALYYLSSILLIAVTVLFLNLEIFPWSSWFKMPPMPIAEEINRQNSEGIRWFREFMHLIIALLGSTLFGITRFANKKEKEAFGFQNEKLETELKFLKSQVNPHFLFNALNNIYSLAVMQAPQTPESVMQLSEILRYMVYDSNEPSVSLNNEIKYIENFVDLHLLKNSKGMNVELNLDKSAPSLKVAPLLFIPFVENAFKHSKIENLKEGFIKIKLEVIEKAIIFSCSNSKPKEVFTKDGVGGVGLVNTKKRLSLLYPDRHNLTIKDTDEMYEVILKITLS